MKVLLINGSPHREGCTYTALCEVSRALNDNGVDTDIFWIGNKALSGCIACKKCQGTGKCVFQDSVNEFLEIAGDYDGFVFGTPVHWAGATGAMTSFMDRVFYADLNGGSTWFENAQNWAKEKGISDGANPNGTINRAQMVTMLWRAMGQPAAGGNASFADVPADSYYAQAVAWAIENGITAGVGGGRFDPNSTCTRGQIATFLYRYMK